MLKANETNDDYFGDRTKVIKYKCVHNQQRLFKFNFNGLNFHVKSNKKSTVFRAS